MGLNIPELEVSLESSSLSSSYNKLSAELPLEVRTTYVIRQEVCGLVDGSESLGEDKTDSSISPILFTHK